MDEFAIRLQWAMTKMGCLDAIWPNPDDPKLSPLAKHTTLLD